MFNPKSPARDGKTAGTRAPGTIRLSKSKIIAGRQCPKRLWLQVNKRDLADDSGSQAVFAIGHEVGAVAQRVYPKGSLPKGVVVGTRDDLSGSMQRTQAALNKASPCVLFEATFQADDTLVMADILEKQRSELSLIEVKSSTSVKATYRDDVAVQAHVMSRAGFAPDKVFLRVIDTSFVYAGDGDYRGLFKDEDLTHEALARGNEISGWISSLKDVLAGGEPQVDMGAHCQDPHECEFRAYCVSLRGEVPTEFPVSILPNAAKLIAELESEGFRDIRDVPAKRLNTNTTHLRIRDCSKRGKRYLDDGAVRKALDDTEFPRFYLDFEGVSPAVPRWRGTRPYQQLPFQWSLHVERKDGSIEHQAFLHDGVDAPMRPAMDALLAAIGTRGTVFVYNKSYEGSVLRNMALMFPAIAKPLQAIEKRFVDLLEVARNHYYHPAMMGSWSIKSVLPTIAPELGYGNLDGVQDGGSAQMAFLRMIASETSATEREQIRRSLLQYCERDTLAMVRIVQAFCAG